MTVTPAAIAAIRLAKAKKEIDRLTTANKALEDAVEMLLRNHRLNMIVHARISAQEADDMLVAVDARAALALSRKQGD